MQRNETYEKDDGKKKRMRVKGSPPRSTQAKNKASSADSVTELLVHSRSSVAGSSTDFSSDRAMSQRYGSSESLLRDSYDAHSISPFSFHPALSLGANDASLSGSGRGSSSPVVPQYRPDTLIPGAEKAARGKRGSVDSMDSMDWSEDKVSNGSLQSEKEVLLLEYYWSHYWWRSVA